MKFIFPQNYNFENKILGVIDYTTALFNVVWYLIIFLILFFLPISFQVKLFIFILFCFPLFLISFTGFNGENVIYVLKYLLLFSIKQKIFFYEK